MSEPLDREVVVFNTAVELPAAQRDAYLIEACGGDQALKRRIEALLQADDQAGQFLQEPAAGTLLSPAAGDAGHPPSSAEGPGQTIGRYKLLQPIGEGGCGVVYLAEQEEPVHRRVALKVIKLGMDTKSVIARFEAERQALALMDHPNIARVLDAGATATGRPFFVMELVRGEKITDFCDRNSLSTRERLDLFVQVCRAVQHAHQKGIIHRDLKPSNILVTVNDGVPVPKVIDFGIAKATQGRLTDRTLFTAFEQFIGTPAYMSPEQTVLTSVDVDTRSDVYSLGVLLYELLTGRTPFQQSELLASGLEEMRRMIREKEPARPSTRLSTLGAADLAAVARSRQSEPPGLIHLMKGDLDWIAMKCLEKDRARRYETANGLARDVERFLSDEPVAARPPSAFYRFRKLVRRNRVAFIAAGAVVAALVAGLGVSTWQYREKSRAEREQSRLRESAQRAQANEARSRRRAEVQEIAARRIAYASDMNLLQQALAADDLGRAQELLNRQRPRQGEPDLRGWEWRYFWQFCQSDAAFTLCQRSNSVVTVAFSSDGGLLGVATWEGEVTVWDVAGRRILFQADDQGNKAGRLAFAPHGDFMVYHDSSAGSENAVVWDSRRRVEVRRLPLNGALRDVTFVSGGRLFTADWGRSNNITMWEAASGKVLARFTGLLPAYGNGTVFTASPDGGRFAHVLGDRSDTVRVVETADGRERRIRVADELTTAIAFDPGAGMFVTGAGYADGALRLWDVTSGRSAGVLEGHRSWVSCLKYFQDGRTLASASADRTVRLWDMEARHSIRTLRGQNGELWTVDLSPDGRWLASGGKDGSVVFWDLTSSTGRPPSHRALNPAPLWHAGSYSPDGRWFCHLRGGRLHLHDARTLEPVSEPAVGLTNLIAYAFSPDMRLLVTSEPRGRMEVRTWPDLEMVTNFVAHSKLTQLGEWSFRRGGSTLLTCGSEHDFKEWDVVTWKEIGGWQTDADMIHRAFAEDADRVAVANENGWVELTTAGDPERRSRLKGENRLIGIDLSPDGRTLAAASENGTVELWDTETRTRTALLRGVLLGCHSVAISPDGQRVAAGSNGQEAVTLWDIESQEEVATLAGQGSFFSEAKFSPDGNTISARNWNGVIHFWMAPSWDQIQAAEQGLRKELR